MKPKTKRLRVRPAEAHGWGVCVFYAASKTHGFLGHSKVPGYRWFGTFAAARAYCRELNDQHMRGVPVRVRVRMSLSAEARTP